MSVEFSEVQIERAQDIADSLYSAWSVDTDQGAKLLSVSFFLASVIEETADTFSQAEKLQRAISDQAWENLKATPGWPTKRIG